MSNYRFKAGNLVLCNLGENGWKLGRVIALNYRETHWPAEQTAPYQVMLDDDHSLIYVPQDDDRLCREATAEDLKIIGRLILSLNFQRESKATSVRLPAPMHPFAARGTTPNSEVLVTEMDNATAAPSVPSNGPTLNYTVSITAVWSEMGSKSPGIILIWVPCGLVTR